MISGDNVSLIGIFRYCHEGSSCFKLLMMLVFKISLTQGLPMFLYEYYI